MALSVGTRLGSCEIVTAISSVLVDMEAYSESGTIAAMHESHPSLRPDRAIIIAKVSG